MDDLLTKAHFRDCHVSEWMDEPIGDPELLEDLARLYEVLDDCQTLMHDVIERKRTVRILEIQTCLNKAMALIEDEL